MFSSSEFPMVLQGVAIFFLSMLVYIYIYIYHWIEKEFSRAGTHTHTHHTFMHIYMLSWASMLVCVFCAHFYRKFTQAIKTRLVGIDKCFTCSRILRAKYTCVYRWFCVYVCVCVCVLGSGCVWIHVFLCAARHMRTRLSLSLSLYIYIYIMREMWG